MPKAKTPSFILELAIVSNAHESAELNKQFEAARQLYNACLDEAKRRLDLLHQSKEFKEARSMPKTVNGKPNKERTSAFKALNAKFGFSEYDIHAYATKIRNSWISEHLDSTTAQKLATRAFSAVQRIAFGQAKRVRFKGRVPCAHQCGNEAQIPDGRVQRTQQGKNQLKSVEGKTNATGIRYIEKTGHVEWNGLKLKCRLDVNDKVVTHGLSHRVKYCRIVKRIFNGKARFFVQLILEGKPFIKEKNESKDKIVGLDIGPSTIAYVSNDVCVGLVHEDSETHCCVRWTHPDDNEAQILSGRAQRTRHYHLDEHKAHKDEHAKIEHFCDELKNKQKEIRRLQRSLERKRRINNPQNYKKDGTIKKGKKIWNLSGRYLRTKTKLAELQRKLATHRKTLHGNLANHILRLGKYMFVRCAHQCGNEAQIIDGRAQGTKHIKTEKLSYKAFQKNYGRSVKDRAPGKFMEILRRKAENASGKVDEFSTKDTKLSQYCHKCGKYTKKPLSQRVHTCCNLNIQRDIYSAFLAGSVSVRCVSAGVSAVEGVVGTHRTETNLPLTTPSTENNNPLTPFGKGELDTADVHERWRSTEAILQRAVSELNKVASGRQLPSSFGLRTRDRATRLRSSDAVGAEKRHQQPLAKDQDVVAVQPKLRGTKQSVVLTITAVL